ncbi:MAG: [FeFe] hydrogenase H-cluster maturation GTPase HydF [Candidatus Izemoplasma sp.]|nr:[FeFe] hydrogenase H-cluster maturation GTPase HydF [Candidatus Izemoplasma sp.]
MSLNKTPRSSRMHIAIFGRRNVGKSSLINALTNQDISVVSSTPGTTTDPVYKSMELLPIGPVVIIDTAGIDDTGDLGTLRVQKTEKVLNKTDIALVVIDHHVTDFNNELKLIKQIEDKKIPFIIVYNKIDEQAYQIPNILSDYKVIKVSAKTQEGIKELKETLGHRVPVDDYKFQIIGDLLHPSDIVVLVVPIDKAAPKGRLILPQQQVIRDCLESDATAIITKEHELRNVLNNLHKPPKMVVTDSQVFSRVSADTPNDIMLTSFSILFARYKGELETLIKGTNMIEALDNNDKILISEGCTHHRQSDDIGTVKIPRWLRDYTGKDFIFEHTSGGGYKEDMSDIKLIIHCGACMLNKKEMMHRINLAKAQNIPILNYGVLIAYLKGILPRVLEPFPLAKMIYNEREET